MISKDLLSRLTPRERRERRISEDQKLWKKLNKVHNFEQKYWMKKRAKVQIEEIPDEKIKKYKQIYDAIDTNRDGSLQLHELIDAFKYSGFKVTEYQLRKDLKIPYDSGIDYINFDTFCKWLYHHIKANNSMFDSLIYSMPSFHRQTQIRSINQHLIARDLFAGKLDNPFKSAVKVSFYSFIFFSLTIHCAHINQHT